MKYRKLPISITQDIPDDYRAQPVDVRILSRAEVLARAESRHEGFTATQLDAGLNVIGATLKDIVKEEMGFNLDIFGASIYIKGSGTLDGNQSFKAVLDFRAGSALQFTASGIHLEEVESVLKGPVIIAVRDAATESVNHLLTPGQIVALKGNYIKNRRRGYKRGRLVQEHGRRRGNKSPERVWGQLQVAPQFCFAGAACRHLPGFGKDTVHGKRTGGDGAFELRAAR